MNEKLNLIEILKDCPKGTKLYSTIFGEVKFDKIEEDHKYPIIFTINSGEVTGVTSEGRHFVDYNGECTLFPSREQRDWSKFTAPWYNIEKQDKQKNKYIFPNLHLTMYLHYNAAWKQLRKFWRRLTTK